MVNMTMKSIFGDNGKSLTILAIADTSLQAMRGNGITAQMLAPCAMQIHSRMGSQRAVLAFFDRATGLHINDIAQKPSYVAAAREDAAPQSHARV